MKIGDLIVEPVHDGVMKAPATAFKGTTVEQWAPHRQFLDSDDMLEFAIGGFLVYAPGGRLVLVDTGIGVGSGAIMGGTGTYTGGALLNNLAAHQVQTSDLSDVVF